MVKYVCTKCNYRFEPESERVSKICPYCDESGLIKEPGAQDLLDE